MLVLEIAVYWTHKFITHLIQTLLTLNTLYIHVWCHQLLLSLCITMIKMEQKELSDEMLTGLVTDVYVDIITQYSDLIHSSCFSVWCLDYICLLIIKFHSLDWSLIDNSNMCSNLTVWCSQSLLMTVGDSSSAHNMKFYLWIVKNELIWLHNLSLFINIFCSVKIKNSNYKSYFSD